MRGLPSPTAAGTHHWVLEDLPQVAVVVGGVVVGRGDEPAELVQVGQVHEHSLQRRREKVASVSDEGRGRSEGNSSVCATAITRTHAHARTNTVQTKAFKQVAKHPKLWHKTSVWASEVEGHERRKFGD